MNDLFGPIQQNFFCNQQQNQMLSNTGFFQLGNRKITLYIFSRRFIPNQVRRTLKYEFGGQFRNALQENIANTLLKHTPTNGINAILPHVNEARSAILPTATGTPLNFASFCDMWTFILIIDNDIQQSPLAAAINVPNRMIYSGFIDDEPVTIGNMGGGYIPNPNALFHTTHHMTMTAQTTFDQFGQHTHVDTAGDYDYVSGQYAQNVSMDGLKVFKGDPSLIANSVIIDSSGGMDNSTFTLSMNPVETEHESVEIPTELNAPTQHLRQVISGLTDAVSYMQMESNNLVGPDIFSGQDVMMSSLAGCLHMGANSAMVDLDPKRPFFFMDLMRKYGDAINLVVVNIPFESQVGLGEPGTPTRRNMLTSVISSSVPGLLSQFGLCEIAFRYNSYQREMGGLGSTNGKRGIWHIINAATLYPVDQASLERSIAGFKMYTEQTIFPIILTNGGHFDLTMHCSASGVSLIDLQLNDMMIEPGMIETNNLLGGLNSPILGTFDIMRNNGGELMNIVNDTRASGSPYQSFPEPSALGTLDLF